jgi:uncharacterized cupin superfamily protein
MTQAREVHPGTFVSSLHPDSWVTDPDVGGEMHVLVEGDDSYVGMTKFDTDPGPIEWTMPCRESVVILEGSVRIEIVGGPTLELAEGDMASLAEGAVTTWHVTVPYRELWIFPRTFPDDEAG